MKEKDLRRLSRADLLEMLIDQSKEMQKLQERLEQAESELKKREIAIQNAGSIAEASLMLNGVFEAAQAACREYVENTRKYCEPHEAFGVSAFDRPVYIKPEHSLPETAADMSYMQYLRQPEKPKTGENQYVKPLHKEPSPTRRRDRTARYLNAVDSTILES